MKIYKILACVDFSEYTLKVLEYAVELAKDPTTQIVIYNVINERDVHMVQLAATYAPSTTFVEDYVEDRKKDRLEKIKDLVSAHFFEKKSRLSFKIDVGVPFEQILKTAETEDIDLIVMANKGRGNLSRFFFGSSAEKVFRHSPVPVVSVRDRKSFKREK